MASIFEQFEDDFQRFWQYSVYQKQMEMANFVNSTGFHEVDGKDVGWLILIYCSIC